MLVLQTCCLIILISTATFSFGETRQKDNGKDSMTNHETKELESSVHYFQPTSKSNSQLPTKLKRSRRSSPGTQTPYFSGQCFLCPSGTPGPRGPPGPQGIPGRDGRDGRDAINERGNAGIYDTPVLQTDSTVDINTNGGAVYVRWGRNECPPQSELIYEGIAGGSFYSHKGGGSNYLCMPNEPIYDEPIPGSSGQNRGYVYGAEFETNTFANWNHLHNHNVRCAVCWSRNRSSLVMIPARTLCPGSEWTKEYSGYLVSDYHGHRRSEFVCMDRNAEGVPDSAHNADGALFYPVEGRCGSSGSGLLCGPYVDGNELTCAVCTR